MRNKTYIIAEIGNTHEGSVGLAKQFIKSAKDCGVDAVKLQTHIFSAESLDDALIPHISKMRQGRSILKEQLLTYYNTRNLLDILKIFVKLTSFHHHFLIRLLIYW